METNIQPMLTPPPHGASAIAVAGEARRARKRSRYLSPPYTDDTDDDDLAVHEDDERHEEELPPIVCAADVLSALHGPALLDLDPNAAQAHRFLALYRRRRSRASSTLFANPLLLPPPLDSDSADKLPSPAAGLGRELLNLSAGPAIPMAHGSPFPAPAKKKRKNPQAIAAATKQQDDAMENAAALQEAGHKMPSQADFAVNATDGVASSASPKRKKKNKRMKNAWHFGNPVALVLDFAAGTSLPSKDELLSTFRRFGFVINPETTIAKEERSARVVFATRAEAEAAYSCAQTLGALGPPFAAPRLQDLPPITLNGPPPVPKLPLTDIRKNLEGMISSLTSSPNSPQAAKPAMGNLVGEMQRLLAKVDKMLQGASSTVHHN